MRTSLLKTTLTLDYGMHESKSFSETKHFFAYIDVFPGLVIATLLNPVEEPTICSHVTKSKSPTQLPSGGSR